MTVDLLERLSNTLLTERSDLMRQAEARGASLSASIATPSLLTAATKIAQVPGDPFGPHRSAKPTGVEYFCLSREQTNLHFLRRTAAQRSCVD
jgi:hypothetical protein